MSKECTADYKKKVSYFAARTVKNCHECEKTEWLFSAIGKGDEQTNTQLQSRKQHKVLARSR